MGYKKYNFQKTGEARLQFSLKLAHYLEIKSKNILKIKHNFDQHSTLSRSTYNWPISYIYIHTGTLIKNQL